MKRVILDIDDRYANILTISLVGNTINWDALRSETYVTTSAFDITKFDHITVDKKGKFTEEVQDEHA